MKRSLLLAITVLLSASGLVLAQPARLMLEITPSHTTGSPLTVQPGETVQFSAKAFEFSTGQKQEVQIDQLSWEVDPAAFGAIDANGLLTVAQNPAPRGAVIATAMVGNATVRSVTAVTLAPPQHEYTFEGTVSSTTGPIAGAHVSVMGAGMLPFIVDGRTDAHGNYSIDVPAGEYYVRAMATGYLYEFYDDTQSMSNATKFTTDPANKLIDNIDFVLGTGGTIRGTVYSVDNSTPLEGASVMLQSQSGGRYPGSNTMAAHTDANGEYEITGLPDGDYVVLAKERDHLPQYFDGKSDPSQADKVTISAAAAVSGIDFILQKRQQDPVFTITGTVYDAQNNPIEGAIVFTEMWGGPMLRWLQVRTEADGSYELKVPGGTFVVWAMKSGFVTEYYDNAPDAQQATKLTLDAANPSETGIDFVLGEGGKISGIVRDASTGDPVEGAAVGIAGQRNSNPHGGTHAMFTRTDASGAYTISGLATGDYHVVAMKDGYADEYYDGAADISSATAVAVIDGQETQGIDFALDQLPGISGTVTDASSGAPIAKALIVLDGPNSRSFAHTDSQGQYHLSTHPGTYHVHCAAAGYQDEWYDDVTDIAQAADVTVPQTGSVTGIDFALDRFGGSIAGVVRDENGAPIADARVLAWANMTPHPGRMPNGFGHAVTAADGSYLIEGLPQGDYHLRAEARGFIGEFYDGVSDLSSATKVTVATQPVTGIDFTLGNGGSISGTITDEDSGDPLPHAFVKVRAANHRFEQGARTDANGQYTITGLPDDDYIVFAAAHRHLGEFFDDAPSPKQATPVNVTGAADVTGIDFALAAAPIGPRPYRGRVIARRGGAPAFVIVEALNPATGASISTTTDERGSFELHAWENAVIRARALGYVGVYAGNTHSWKESRWEGVSGEMTLTLDPIADNGLAELRGRITDAQSGQPLANAWVYGIDAAGHVFFSVTGSDGRYMMENTPNGSLDVMVSEVAYETEHGQASVQDARGTADFSLQPASVTGVGDEPRLPASVTLQQNYPNPFNPSTTIRFTLPERMRISLRVFNLLGQEVATVADGIFDAGSHDLLFSASALPSGIYLYQLKAGGSVQTRRMTLMK